MSSSLIPKFSRLVVQPCSSIAVTSNVIISLRSKFRVCSNVPNIKATCSIRNKSTLINVHPATALVDEKVAIRITGLEPESKITVRASIDEEGTRFESFANYVATYDGLVDMTKQPSLNGTFTGTEEMGLFWSMIQTQFQGKRKGFRKVDIDTPIVVDLSVHKGHLNSHTAFQNDIPMASTQVHRWYKADNVERIHVRSGNVRGVIYKPKGSGPYPGIIDMFGSNGGTVEFRAALLASRGFAVLALPFFLYEDLPKSTWDIDFEYFEESLDWFGSLSYVGSGGVGVIGTSLGATIGLLMASHRPDMVSAAVSISGTCVNMFTFSLRHRGEYMPMAWYEPSKMVQTGFGTKANQCCEDVRHVPDDTIIPVEKASNLLFIVGEDDQNTATLLHAMEAIKRLKRYDHESYKLLSYPGAGHLIEPRYSIFNRNQWHREFGFVLDMGGNAVDHSKAQEDSWPKILQFLQQHVG